MATLPNPTVVVVPPTAIGDPEFPQIESITIADLVGPIAANRQPGQLRTRDDTLRDRVNDLAENSNAIQSGGPSGLNLFVPRELQHDIVADLTALAAIIAGERVDGTIVVVASENAIWRFDAASAATADGEHIVQPAAGSGRWIHQHGFVGTFVLPSGLVHHSTLQVKHTQISGVWTTADGDTTSAHLEELIGFFNNAGTAPTGSIVAYAGASAPAGWVICNGATFDSVSDTSFAALFALISTTFGPSSGGGAANFKVPDLQGRSPIGVGVGAGEGSSDSAGGSEPSGAALTARNRGAWGGEEGHVLTTGELASHRHGSVFGAGGPIQAGLRSAATSNSTSVTGFEGDDDPHNTVHPFLGLNFIIKK